MNKYENTVGGALDEKRGKYALAEGLARDIPPITENVRATLLEAREAIIEAGGEPRSTASLDDYRRTALWVSDDLTTDFGWVNGRSWSSHAEARKVGLTRDEFAALTDDEAKVDALRTANGRRGSHAGTVDKDAVDAVKRDPEVIKAMLDDADAAEAIRAEQQKRFAEKMAKRRAETQDSRMEQGFAPTPDEDEPSKATASLSLFGHAMTIEGVIGELRTVVQAARNLTDPLDRAELAYNDRVDRLRALVDELVVLTSEVPDDLSTMEDAR